MPIIPAPPPWKLNLQPASFNGVVFHVAVQDRASGRRIAMHEFPNRDLPYAEDLGRRFRRFTVLGYVVGPNFEFDRDQLIEQLESEGNGNLVLPTSTDQKTVVCDVYSITERREQGGYAEFQMVFLEAGQDPSTVVSNDTQSTVNNTANDATGASSNYTTLTNTFMNSSDITVLT